MIACLAAAALWAIAVSLFRRALDDLGPSAVNVGKCAFASLCFWVGVLVASAPPDLGARAGTWSIVALSGVIGMALGDTLLFVAVRDGGVQRALVLFNTSPVMAAVAAVAIYGETPSAAGWIGMAVTLAGVMLVETDPARPRPRAKTGAAWRTAAAGLGAAACQAAGILMNRGPLQVIELVPASAVRLSAASLALLVVMLLTRDGRPALAALAHSRAWQRIVPPTLIGTVLAVYLMMRGIRDVPVATSAALLATTPVFALPIARFVLREPIGARSIVGTLLAVLGVALLGL